MKILVLSCDKDIDTFEPFYHCMEKYWPAHPEIVYTTETIVNPYYKTICKNYDLKHWTKRTRETLAEIEEDHILLLCNDSFLRSSPNEDLILYFDNILNKVDSINLEHTFDTNDLPCEYEHLLKRSDNGDYKTSVMMSMWNKDKLMQVLDFDDDPWEFEMKNNHCNFNYYINKEDIPIDIGHHKTGDKWGIYRGKWCRECLNFFEKEGINIDSSKRGIYE